MLLIETYGEKIACQKCSARIGTLLGDRVRVKIGDQYVETRNPLTISCARCRYINDFTLTEVKAPH